VPLINALNSRHNGLAKSSALFDHLPVSEYHKYEALHFRTSHTPTLSSVLRLDELGPQRMQTSMFAISKSQNIALLL
jgi:hypothetical protein